MVDTETEYGTRVGCGLFAGAHVRSAAGGGRGAGGGAGTLVAQAQ